jgi:hypothetical protein
MDDICYVALRLGSDSCLSITTRMQHMERSAATAYVTLTPRYTCVNEGQ